MRERSEHAIENVIEMFADILSQKTQYKITVLLQQSVFSPVAPVSFGLAEVLRAVQFDRDARFGAKEIHFHVAAAVEGNRQRRVQPKTAGGFRQGLQPAKEKRLAGAARIELKLATPQEIQAENAAIQFRGRPLRIVEHAKYP